MNVFARAMSDSNRGPELLIITWVFTALAVTFVALKLFTRIKIIHGLYWDDFFIVFSVVLVLVCTSVFTYDVHLGMGKHAWDIPLEQLGLTVKVNFIANPFGIMAYSFPNISVVILIDRILPLDKVKRCLLYALAVSQCLIAAISCILLFTQCTPSQHLWDPTISARCLPSTVITGYSYFVGAYSGMTDTILAIVPVVAFAKLQMKLKAKIELCFLMSLTLFAAICAIVKTTHLSSLSKLHDFTYETVDLIIWAVVEANVIIMAACVPSLRPLIKFLHSRGQIKEDESFRGSTKVDSKPSGTKPHSGLPFSGKAHSRSTDHDSVTELTTVPSRAVPSQDDVHGIERTTEIKTVWEAV